MSERPAVVIIGPGVVGQTLGILAARAGYEVAAVGAREQAKARAAAERIGPGVFAGGMEDAAARGELILLTVSDDAIEPVCRRLAEVGAVPVGSVVAHCSGAQGSGILAAARDRGAAVGSMHPLQTFPDVEAALEKAGGTFFFCEGDEPAVERLTALAEAVGGLPKVLSPSGKLLYHASAVMACNYLNALLDAALATAEHAGITREDAAEALAPLVRATVENVLSAGPAGALTGPVARGDERLVARQYRDVAAADRNLGEIYRRLGWWTVEVALRKGTLDEAGARSMRAIFEFGGSDG